MIIFLNNTLAPYHASRFQALKAALNEDIIFVELASNNNVYCWADQAEQAHAICLIPDREISTIPAREMVHSVDQLLSSHKPDVVIVVSYSSAGMRYGSLWARQNGAVSICVNESWHGDKIRWFIKEWAKGLWCRLFYDGMFVGGTRSKEYYRSLGFAEERFWLGQNTVDNDFYAARSKEVRDHDSLFRKRFNLPIRYFLCPARLSPVKNLARLIKSFSKYKADNGKWDLVITGSGPLEQDLKTLSRDLRLENNVIFSGWKQIDDMPVFYGLASCMILPSISEPWGLVVNEAMASSLPVLVSNKCGCQPELCFRGVNGFDFNPFLEDEMTAAMLKISSTSSDLGRMGSASYNIIQRFSPENYALSLSDCINTLRENKITRR
ncbi:MAG: glycosyltransferase family 4 protein [Anaerolineaceae bacterium]